VGFTRGVAAGNGSFIGAAHGGAMTVTTMGRPRRIALVAHDNRKDDLLAWAAFNVDTLMRHRLVATGTTGSLLHEQLELAVERVQSGPLGGDLQIGAQIVEGAIDMLVFFWDPLEPQPHDPDVKALLRITVLLDVPTACNRSTADYLISSPLFAVLPAA